MDEIKYVSAVNIYGLIKDNKFKFAILNKENGNFYIFSDKKIVKSSQNEYVVTKVDAEICIQRFDYYKFMLETLFVKYKNSKLAIAEDLTVEIDGGKYFKIKDLLKLEKSKNKVIMKFINNILQADKSMKILEDLTK